MINDFNNKKLYEKYIETYIKYKYEIKKIYYEIIKIYFTTTDDNIQLNIKNIYNIFKITNNA